MTQSLSAVFLFAVIVASVNADAAVRGAIPEPPQLSTARGASSGAHRGISDRVDDIIKSTEAELDSIFQSFAQAHGRAYLTVKERDHRFGVFKANLQAAAALQAQNPHAVFGVNKFFDLSPEEFRSRNGRRSVNKTARGWIWGPTTAQPLAPTLPPTDAPATAPPPTRTPTSTPPAAPTAAPTSAPTAAPTKAPTHAPTAAPTKAPTHAPTKAPTAAPTAAPTNKVDWRAKGAVTSVRDQGGCGCCFAFSATGNLEAQWFLKTGQLVELSEQQIASCDTTDSACAGGLEYDAWQWLISNNNGQQYTEASYPYTSGNGNVARCNTAGAVVGATVTGYTHIAQNEDAIASFMLTGGPVSVGVDSTSWQSYVSGILTNCVSNAMDHSVLAVGFDDTHNPPYWIVKNSWGANWGESGYIRVEKGSNQCLIANDPSVSVA